MFNFIKPKKIREAKHTPEQPSTHTQAPIIYNAAQCVHCLDILESVTVHDYKKCSCGRISVDGGKYYIRRGYINSSDIHELSLYAFSVVEPNFTVSASMRGSDTAFTTIKFYVTKISEDGTLINYRAVIDHGSRARPEGSHSVVDIEEWPRFEKGLWTLVSGVLKTANLQEYEND